MCTDSRRGNTGSSHMTSMTIHFMLAIHVMLDTSTPRTGVQVMCAHM